MIKGLIFEEGSHTYRYEGKVVPSVTQILKPISPDFSMVPPETLERARAIGVAVDRTICLHEVDDLDEESLDPMLEAYLAAWKQLKALVGIKVLGVQEMVFHPAHRYAGTLDIRATVNGAHSVIDIKRSFSLPRSVGPQTAAYQEAWNAMIENQPIERRFAVHLKPKDGSIVGRLEPLTHPNDKNIFLACLTVWRFNNEH